MFRAELSFRKTFTDYIDDVSNTYANPDVLLAEKGSISYQLANRTGEYLNTKPIDFKEGKFRDNPDFKDWYGFAGIKLSYIFTQIRGDGSSRKGNLQCPWN